MDESYPTITFNNGTVIELRTATQEQISAWIAEAFDRDDRNYRKRIAYMSLYGIDKIGQYEKGN